MSLATILRQGWTALVLMLMLAATASAQRGRDDDGEYQILQARYGTAQHHVDVTQQLKQLAREDRRFKLVNDVFGVDPDPGRRKTLRIFARGRDGQERTFEYEEYSQVDGSQFTGWGRGDWGHGGWSGGWGDGSPGGGRPHGRDDDGDYQILQANYGTSRRHIDVTQRLKELARRDRSFRIGNDTFGADPDPGRIKMLRIYTRGRDGRSRTFEYKEGSLIDGAQFTGWGRGDWGQGGWGGGWGGGRDDGDEPQFGGARLRIISARYGYGGNTVDVSDRLRELVRRNRLELRVDNSLADSDPAPGRRKTLTLTYAPEGGDVQQVRVNERDMLRVP